MKAPRICIAGVRALHDLHGAAFAADLVRRLARANTSLLVNHLNREGWEDVFPGATSVGDVILVMRRASSHININVRLAPQVMMAEGMILIQPTSPFADDLRASASVATAAVGRPVTALLAHPLLDAGMTVSEVMTSRITESRVSVDGWNPLVSTVLATLDSGCRP